MTDKRWSTPEDLRRELLRRWESGAILSECAGSLSIFPYRFRLNRPGTADLGPRYDGVRSWAAALAGAEHVRVVHSSQGARSIGRNDIPREAWIDDIDAAAAMIDQTDAVARFRNLVSLTREQSPQLVEWMASHPMDCLGVAHDWPRLLQVVDWMRKNPQPDVYVRQVKIPGVNTKLMQRNAKVLSSMLDTVLSAGSFDPEQTSFERRYGFRVVPQTVQVRTLDAGRPIIPGSGDRPVTLAVEDFAQLRDVERVFVTENYVNFLSFPSSDRSIVVFGQGYDVGKIALTPWIHNVPVFYWGDIDTHGFAILDLLRSKLPRVRSLLMDHATLHAHEEHWGEEQSQVRRDLSHLTRPEKDLYDDLRDNRIRPNLRFEQELTDYALIEEAVAMARRPGSYLGVDPD